MHANVLKVGEPGEISSRVFSMKMRMAASRTDNLCNLDVDAAVLGTGKPVR